MSASNRERLAEEERQALREEIAHLRSLAESSGDINISDTNYKQQHSQHHVETRVTSSVVTTRTVEGEMRMLSQTQIREIFEFYANYGRSAVMTYQDSLDSFMFMKFARECPSLLDETVTPTEVDLIFVKAKPKFERRLSFEHFLDALAAIAERKYPDVSPRDSLRHLVHNNLAPLYDLVQEEVAKTGETEVPLPGVFKKLYDPRSYTGVYAERFRSGDGRINGETESRAGKFYKGSTNTATDEQIHDVSSMMRPNLHGSGTMLSPSNHALARKPVRPSSSNKLTSPKGVSLTSPSGGSSVRPASTSTPVASSHAVAGQLEQLHAAMEKAKSGDAADLMSLTLALAEQVKALQTGQSSKTTTTTTASSATKADAAVAHEIEELEHDVNTLEASLHRGVDADTAREVQQAIDARNERISALRSSRRVTTSTTSPRPLSTKSPRVFKFAELGEPKSSDSGSQVPGAPALSQDQIRAIFDFYCNFGRSAVMTFQDSLDNFMFMKFAKECPDLLDKKVLTPTEIDLIFMKAKPKFERRLQFTHFLDALSAIAERKYPDYSPQDGLRLLISNQLAPLYDIVQAEMQKTGETEIPLSGVFKKLYDPRNYTGVYAERFRTGDGRINGESDNRPGRSFNGNTNTQTDEIIHDISTLMRPNLRSGTMMRSRPVTPGGSPGRLARSTSPRRGLTSPSSVHDSHSVASRR